MLLGKRGLMMSRQLFKRGTKQDIDQNTRFSVFDAN